MSYLCLNCTRKFVDETIEYGLTFDGVTYEDGGPIEGKGEVCARCEAALPESPERELAARVLLLEAMRTEDKGRIGRGLQVLGGGI